jgi:hypothetical protein
LDQFKAAFPHLLSMAQHVRFLIPLLHVQNHEENCTYLFSSAYKPGAGHFHGETAEQYWAELNQIGPQVRQMNHGRRLDTLIDSHSRWNWKKTAQMSLTLKKAIIESHDLFLQHREHFQVLTEYHQQIDPEKLNRWNQQSRTSRNKVNGEVECVYRHNQGKVPSQKQIYQALVQSKKTNDNMASATRKQDSESPAYMLHKALQIQDIQKQVIHLKAQLHKYGTKELEDTLNDQAEKLFKQMESFCSVQKRLCPQDGVASALAKQAQAKRTPDCKVLYVPSDFTSTQCQHYGLVELAS